MDLAGEPLLAAGIGLLAGAAWLWRSGARRPASAPRTTRARAPDRLLVQDSAALLAPHADLIARIARESRLSQTVFARECRPLLEAYASFVQALPASESHHHAQPGGMLLHALETAVHALRLRRGMLLPQGVPIEDLARLQHRYSWIVLAAALLHDVGKPLTDLRITWYGREATAGQAWAPLAGALPELGALDYTVAFRSGRDYEAHARLSLVLLPRLAPPSALRWLAQAPPVLDELTAYLGGEGGDGALAQLIRAADAASVRENLKSGSRVRFASAQGAPLIERLMAGLRRMFAEGRVPLNRSGACGWVYQGELWLVAGRIADELRTYLQDNEAEGGAGLPGHDKNDRLFDTFQDYGACLATPEGRAVWRVRVEGPDYAHELTCLRFAVRTLFEDAARAPAPMAGRIEILGSAAAAPLPAADEPEPNVPLTQEAASANPADKNESHPAPTAAESAFLDHDDLLEADETAAHAASAPALSAPVTLATPNLPALAGDASAVPPLAGRFMGWLQAGLGSGEITYNQAQAAVHFVAEGMLIVSPRAFVEFIARCGALGDGARADEPERKSINRLQGALAKAGWTVPVSLAKGAKGNIHKYHTVKRGQRGGQLSGVLVAEPARFVNPVPPANALLVRAGSEPAA